MRQLFPNWPLLLLIHLPQHPGRWQLILSVAPATAAFSRTKCPSSRSAHSRLLVTPISSVGNVPRNLHGIWWKSVAVRVAWDVLARESMKNGGQFLSGEGSRDAGRVLPATGWWMTADVFRRRHVGPIIDEINIISHLMRNAYHQTHKQQIYY